MAAGYVSLVVESIAPSDFDRDTDLVMVDPQPAHVLEERVDDSDNVGKPSCGRARRSLTVGRMAQDPNVPAIDPAMRGYIDHVLRQLLLPGELDEWKLRWELQDEGRWQLMVDVAACGEPYLGFITERDSEDPVEGLDIFTDGFEDFISESRFAWGQRRELKERPWRRSP